jgi:carbonic anhydrase
MKAHTKETQALMTPEKSIEALKKGNERFQNNFSAERDLLEQVKDTTMGQFPFATVLSCIDSRIPVEMVFDQGIGDLFSVRIAGNFINDDILGSMEFACKLAGSKVVVVLGHTSCGAVKGACDGAELGKLTGMLNKIKPAVNAVVHPANAAERTSANIDFVNEVAAKNVEFSIEGIRSGSEVLAEMERNGEIAIVGAMYDVATGKVTFYE